MSDKSGVSNTIISLPKGGGALHGLGEKFSPDLFTGTGNLTVPISLPPGRNGFQPQLSLVYSTGNGNGPFGFGWNLSVPGVSRKTAKGIPIYDEAKDTFILSGAEDLVPVGGEYPGRVLYRPRTEGLFAKIEHVRGANNSYWEVRSKDGLVSYYGTPESYGADAATVADPTDRARVFSWKLTHTEDPFGNRIEYEYERDMAADGPHHWDQLYLAKIRYVDYNDQADHRQFLVSVEFVYETRADDPHSEYRSGFEIRTRKRCAKIVTRIKDQLVRTYELIYLDERAHRAELKTAEFEAALRADPVNADLVAERDAAVAVLRKLQACLPANGVSVLSQVKVTGQDGDKSETMPPLEFGYTTFEPQKRVFFPLQGSSLPPNSLANPALELVDLFGNGLPDLIEMDGTVRYWRNLGGGRFDSPRFMRDAPAGLALADSGVQIIDANGDGRPDLLITKSTLSGYFPISFGGQWDHKSFQRYRQAPSFNLEDPEVKLVDLDGDGVTDAIHAGSGFDCYFNDPGEGWIETLRVERQTLDIFPNVNFSDPRVKWADFTGSGLQTIALVHDGSVQYWPHLGRGKWGKRVSMANSPRFPYGHDPRHILVGDVDGDGLADIVYVENAKVTLWINQSGNRWSEPIEITGTPQVSDMDAVRLVDALGSGIGGVLWTRDANGASRDHMFFLDFTGGLKPYLLSETDNHIGSSTKVEYAPSTSFYQQDQKLPATQWRTTLPFPVHVVSRVEVLDHFSKGKLTTQYRYHHGHWDGAEREFRGFGMVEQQDTEVFEKYDRDGLHEAETVFAKVDRKYFSPPTLSKTWFHLGPVGEEAGDWQELDWSNEYWTGDRPLLGHIDAINRFLKGLAERRVKRDALRALRGSVLRNELYALDGSAYEQRPYTVSESSYGLEEVDLPVGGNTKRLHIFFPHSTSQRTTQWERGDDPMTQFSFTRYTDDADKFDSFGRPLAQTLIACPRGWRKAEDKPSDGYLATQTNTVYAEPAESTVYIHNRVARVTSFEIKNTSGKRVSDFSTIKNSDSDIGIIGQTLSFYDGDAFVGLALKQVGNFGAVTRTESLVLTDQVLQQAYGAELPPYLEPTEHPAWSSDYPSEFRTLLPDRAGYAFHAGSADPADPKGYFAITSRQRYDFQTTASPTARGLVLESLDPLHDAPIAPAGHRTLIAYDKFDFLPERVTDAAGLTMRAVYDYRVLQPSEVIDGNGNKTRFTFSPLGFLVSSFVLGKNPMEGDQSRPSTRMEFGFLAFETSPPEKRQPIFVRTIRQIHHDTEMDVSLPERDETITTVEYSDGFGRLLQTRTQGEEIRFGDERFGGGESVLSAKQSGGVGGDVIGHRNTDEQKPNVVVSGWQIYDNKGRVVEKYEPFFSEGWEYDQLDDPRTGQRVAMFYDPRGHAIRTVSPDGSEQRVIFGVPGTIAGPDLERPDVFEPTPWEAYTYDANDNAGRTHLAASSAYQHHWNTPASILVDARGRVVKTVARNRNMPARPEDALPAIQELITSTTYDIRGNALTLTDALGRLAFQYVYDLANRNLRIESIDAGIRKVVMDTAGGIVEQRDSKGALVLHGYDHLNRPLRLWARDALGQSVSLRQRLEYGDAGSPNQPAANRAVNQAVNRLGRLMRHFDDAGLVEFDAYDFQGNLLQKRRRVVSDGTILEVFAGPPRNWEVDAFRVDWTNPDTKSLDSQAYVSTLGYDALNRVKLMIYPEDVENQRRTLRPLYNRAGALESVTLERTSPNGDAVNDTFVQRIAYNAKGQRVLIAYGNKIMTRHAYDPMTFRRTHLRTERYISTPDLTYRPVGQPLQEFGYDYDLAGNITRIHDRTPTSGVHGSVLGSDALDREFVYDALYRLQSATGRECDLPPDLPWDDAPRCIDPTKTKEYTEQYQYDTAGNIERLRHLADRGSFTRDFALVIGTNRLRTVTVGAAISGYKYDANGNLTQETTSRHFEWNYADRMGIFRTQTESSEPSVHAHYLYDASGQRVKKLVRKQGGRSEATVYIDGLFEYQRIVRAGIVEDNNMLHLMDDKSRIALIRVGEPFSQDTTPAVKYHLGDHLGSSNVVVNDSGTWVNREEYTPYGETSFGGFSRKRYRFTGKEKDEESGLSYHDARYFASWLGRWASCDPAGLADSTNLYIFVQNRPLTRLDPDGRQSTDNQEEGGRAPIGGQNEVTGVPTSQDGSEHEKSTVEVADSETDTVTIRMSRSNSESRSNMINTARLECSVDLSESNTVQSSQMYVPSAKQISSGFKAVSFVAKIQGEKKLEKRMKGAGKAFGVLAELDERAGKGQRLGESVAAVATKEAVQHFGKTILEKGALGMTAKAAVAAKTIAGVAVFLGAPSETEYVAETVASALPSEFAGELASVTARAAVNLITGDSAGMRRLGEDIYAGRDGGPLQGYTVLAGATAASIETGSLEQGVLAAVPVTPESSIAKLGSAIGDGLYKAFH